MARIGSIEAGPDPNRSRLEMRVADDEANDEANDDDGVSSTISIYIWRLSSFGIGRSLVKPSHERNDHRCTILH